MAFLYVVQLPLGYNVDVCHSGVPPSVVNPINKRQYTWSFIGEIKQDRQQGIDLFSDNTADKKYYSGAADRADLGRYYNDSMLVLSGRGNFNIGCFRTTEAITFGAVPLVISPVVDFELAYGFNNEFDDNMHIPPIPRFDQWGEAIEYVKCQLQDPPRIQETSDKLRYWFNGYNDFLKIKINIEL